MDKKQKKMIAPIVIAIIVIAYELFWLSAVLYIGMTVPQIFLGAVIPLTIALMMIYVTRERLHEIRSGEEDDLSEY